MSSIPAQSSLVTDEQAYTVECQFCSAKVGEPCINVRSVTDSTREPQYYSSGVHKARIKTYKALNNIQDVEPPKPVNKPKTSVDVVYVTFDGIAEPLPMKVKVVEIYAVVQSTEKAIQVENLDQFTAWIPKSAIISSSKNVLYIHTSLQINWIKSVTQ